MIFLRKVGGCLPARPEAVARTMPVIRSVPRQRKAAVQLDNAHDDDDDDDARSSSSSSSSRLRLPASTAHHNPRLLSRLQALEDLNLNLSSQLERLSNAILLSRQTHLPCPRRRTAMRFTGGGSNGYVPQEPPVLLPLPMLVQPSPPHQQNQPHLRPPLPQQGPRHCRRRCRCRRGPRRDGGPAATKIV